MFLELKKVLYDSFKVKAWEDCTRTMC